MAFGGTQIASSIIYKIDLLMNIEWYEVSMNPVPGYSNNYTNEHFQTIWDKHNFMSVNDDDYTVIFSTITQYI